MSKSLKVFFRGRITKTFGIGHTAAQSCACSGVSDPPTPTQAVGYKVLPVSLSFYLLQGPPDRHTSPLPYLPHPTLPYIIHLFW